MVDTAAACQTSSVLPVHAEVQQTGMQRSVMKFMPGKITSEKYEQRVDNCTKDQLSLLLTSPDYEQWQQSKQAPKPRPWRIPPEALLGLLFFTVIPLVALAPYYVPSQQVGLFGSLCGGTHLKHVSVLCCMLH